MSKPDPGVNSSNTGSERAQFTGRWRLLLQIERILEPWMALLGFVWLALLAVELIRGLSSFLEKASILIWIVFIVDFAIKLFIAPSRSRFLRHNWLTAISLLVPALRIFRLGRLIRVLRMARSARSLRLVKVVSSLNRGMRALRRSFGRKGFRYVLGLTLLMNLLGAAGILAFERDIPDPNGIHDFGTALWWTAMMLTTMGSQYWPKTPEGRLLSLLLSTYAFAIFGYITAVVASFFVGRDTEIAKEGQGQVHTMEKVFSELQGLRNELHELKRSISIKDD